MVVIPPNPEPGQTRAKVHLELDKDEARATIDRLKAMLERLKHMKATGEQFRASAQIAAAPAGPSGEQRQRNASLGRLHAVLKHVPDRAAEQRRISKGPGFFKSPAPTPLARTLSLHRAAHARTLPLRPLLLR